MKAPNQKVEEKVDVPLCDRKDESSGKQAANETAQDKLELTKAKSISLHAIDQVVAELLRLRSEVASSRHAQDIKDEFQKKIPSIENSVRSLTVLHHGPMYHAPSDVLEHLMSFLDHDDTDSFALVSRRMLSIVESYAKGALEELFKKLKEAHFVDDDWPKRVQHYAEVSGACTNRRKLLCAAQVSLCSIRTNVDLFSSCTILPEMNQLISYGPNQRDPSSATFQVMDLVTRQSTHMINGFRQGESIERLQVCGTKIVSCSPRARRTIKIWTMDGDLLHTIRLPLPTDSEISCHHIASVDEMLYCILDLPGGIYILEIDMDSGQTTRRVRYPSVRGFTFTELLSAAGEWLVISEENRGIHVLNPSDLTAGHFFKRNIRGLTCSADNGSYIAAQVGAADRVEIMSVNNAGELKFCHSLTTRCYDDYLLQMMIHGTSLYMTYMVESHVALVPIDVIDMASGTTLGRFSFPLYGSIDGHAGDIHGLFANGHELVCLFHEQEAEDGNTGMTIRTFPMLP